MSQIIVTLKERSDLLTEMFHSGYSALEKVRNAVDGATNVKGVGDVAHPRYLERFQDRKKGSGSPHGRGYIIRERIQKCPLLIFFRAIPLSKLTES